MNKRIQPTLSDGSSSRGAQMGRRNQLPIDTNAPIRLHLQCLQLVDGDYDRSGAYWGYTQGTVIYCAFAPGTVPVKAPNYGTVGAGEVQLFTRQKSREAAKAAVRTLLPNATFYR
jgi:hypothetical protein